MTKTQMMTKKITENAAGRPKRNFQQQSLFEMELPAEQEALETEGALALKPQINPEAEARRDNFSKVKKGEKEYTSRDIQVLEGIQAIRHRPGMYIGATTTSGLMHLVWEALDNS